MVSWQWLVIDLDLGLVLDVVLVGRWWVVECLCLCVFLCPCLAVVVVVGRIVFVCIGLVLLVVAIMSMGLGVVWVVGGGLCCVWS